MGAQELPVPERKVHEFWILEVGLTLPEGGPKGLEDQAVKYHGD
ncbi:MAG TPA: hypothetical protein P5182_08325 [Myxococcota bacterium]|nr:hypothetical protein [Myxococcota bacterium]